MRILRAPRMAHATITELSVNWAIVDMADVGVRDRPSKGSVSAIAQTEISF